MQNFLVSIIVPLYNSSNVIKDTLKSLISQTYDNFEILLIDDGSTDDTYKIISRFINENKNIYYFKKNNGGVASARNFGIGKASGNFIALCDHDELWHPAKLSKQMLLFRRPEIGLVYTGCRTVQLTDQPDFSPNNRTRIYHEGVGCFYKILQYNCIPTSSVVFRKSCIDEVGMFDERNEIHGVDDKHMWLRISYKYEILAVREILVNHRITGGNWSLQEDKMLKSAIFCLDDIVKKFPPIDKKDEKLIRQAYAITYQHYGNNLFYMGEYAKARKCFLCSLEYCVCNKAAFLGFILSCFPDYIIDFLRNFKRKIW